MKKILQFGCFASSVRFGAVVAMVAFLAGCQSDSAGKSVGNRVVEAKYLARLDINRQPLEMDSVEWGSARYFAVKPTAHFVTKPGDGERFGDDFNSSTYQIADGQTIILAGAYETEPYTGRVIIKHAEANGAPRLLAQIREGRLVNTGTVTDAAGDGTSTNTPPANPDLPERYLEFGEVEIRGWRVFEKSETGLNALPVEGFLVEFHDKAKLQLARVEHFVGGQPDGKVTWWHPLASQGAKRQKHYEADYVNGEPEGLATWWRSNGTEEYEAFWQNAKLARATTWNAAGTENGRVLNGNGTLIFLHADGSLRAWLVYVDGVLSKEQWLDEEGKELPKALILFRVDRPFVPAAP